MKKKILFMLVQFMFVLNCYAEDINAVFNRGDIGVHTTNLFSFKWQWDVSKTKLILSFDIHKKLSQSIEYRVVAFNDGKIVEKKYFEILPRVYVKGALVQEEIDFGSVDLDRIKITIYED